MKTEISWNLSLDNVKLTLANNHKIFTENEEANPKKT